MQSMSLPLVVSFIVAFVASFSRIFGATKPFWALFPAWLQVAAPQVVLALGALAQGLAGGISSWTDLAVVFITAGALLMPGFPSHRSNAALPSNPKPPSGPSLVGLTFMFVIAVTLCACPIIKGTVWPVVKDCAPSTATLLTQVETVLLEGGDIDSKLTAIAQQVGADGLALVVCAIKEFEGQAGANTAAAAAAKARGKEFLVKTGNAS